MKMMKLTYLLAFALAVTLAATGCRNHRPVKVTPIPGSASAKSANLGLAAPCLRAGRLNRRRFNRKPGQILKAWLPTALRWPLTRCILPTTAPR